MYRMKILIFLHKCFLSIKRFFLILLGYFLSLFFLIAFIFIVSINLGWLIWYLGVLPFENNPLANYNPNNNLIKIFYIIAALSNFIGFFYFLGNKYFDEIFNLIERLRDGDF
jgi:hypothetical protein